MLTTELKADNDTDKPSEDEASPCVLSTIEKMQCVNIGGCVIRKLQQKYDKLKQKSTQVAECLTALQEMGSKLQKQTSTDAQQHPSNKWATVVNRGGFTSLQTKCLTCL